MSRIQCSYIFALVLGVISALPLELNEAPPEAVAIASSEAVAAPAPDTAIISTETAPVLVPSENAIVPTTGNVPVPEQPINPNILSTGGTSVITQNLSPGQGVGAVTHYSGPNGASAVQTVYSGTLTDNQLAQITGGILPIQGDLLGQQITANVINSLGQSGNLLGQEITANVANSLQGGLYGLGDRISNSVLNSIRQSNLLSQQITNNALTSVTASLNTAGLPPTTNLFVPNAYMNPNNYAQIALANYLGYLPLYNNYNNGMYYNTRPLQQFPLYPYLFDPFAFARRNYGKWWL